MTQKEWEGAAPSPPSRDRKWISATIALALILGFGGYLVWKLGVKPATKVEKIAACQGTIGLQPGNCAPNFSLPAVGPKAEASPVTLASQVGKPTVLYFWNSWCGVCHRTMPDMLKLQKKYAGKVNFLWINNTPEEREGPEGVEQALDDIVSQAGQPPQPNTALAGDELTAAAYRIFAVPQIVVLDANGRIIIVPPQPPSPREMEAALKTLVQPASS